MLTHVRPLLGSPLPYGVLPAEIIYSVRTRKMVSICCQVFFVKYCGIAALHRLGIVTPVTRGARTRDPGVKVALK